MKQPHKKRIQVAVSILSEATKKLDELDRSKLVDYLRRTYEKTGLSPIRGKALPPDIYDKELTTLYVIGKYGLGLLDDYPAMFSKIFYIEERLEEALNLLLQGKVDEARERIKSVSPSGVIDGNMIARLLRIPLTKLVLGFMSEDDFTRILHVVFKAFPEEEKTVRSYVRFFIGFKLAEAIYRGEIRSREYKEALKRALAIRVGFPKTTPGDDYVKAIAEAVFNIPEEELSKVLRIPAKQEGPGGVGEQEPGEDIAPD
ncbi:DUF2192 domain-containing protein [Desulfurococcus mucosus]|uniref:DUF2192 domain-containing protein n=1 Tax=Desulfurococcus mucosus (strain ATCC 35584 / DSM 2162 / JCM 9187 / O7/1) TaxID=765177 RepID=E8R9B6_DESM0|nr:DUF2192 domain-containing protein [Desulfurococcus mucosus]ADV65092.1 Protein of unknown function DUF2192 [Desulfurococcus mucosus DSM 2162]